jgi:ribonuclease HI
MPDPAVLTIHTDGAARGNPGPAAFAYVIARDGQPVIEEAGCIGSTTNNQAEYIALVRALEHAVRIATPQDRLIIHSDSELMVKQMRGEYRVKDEGLKSLSEQARRLCAAFEHPPKFVHVRRAQNGRADELCNLVLDGLWKPASPPAAEGTSPPEETIHERAIILLSGAAEVWSQGDAGNPAPAEVWRQLWLLVQAQDNAAPAKPG